MDFIHDFFGGAPGAEWLLWDLILYVRRPKRQIRASPTYADDARVGHVLHPGQVVVVDDRRMVGETQGRRNKNPALLFATGICHYSQLCPTSELLVQ